MAGIQSCLRIRLNVIKTFRSVSNNGAFRQSTRGRHFLTFQTSSFKNGQYINKSKLFPYLSQISVHRLASTDTTNSGTVSPVLESKISQNTVSTSEVPGSGHSGASQVPSDSNIVIDESTLPPIPSALQPEPEVVEAVLNQLGEPTLKSLGLGSWWPSGILQQCLEYLHVNMELPWWGAIAVVTLCIRVITLPLNIKARRHAVEMQNNMPQIQHLQMKLTEARQTGNYYDAAFYMKELQDFMASKKISVFGSILPGLAQAPFFISMFAGLRGMTNLPVDSMKTGGLLWFQDLTVPDPYYILPLCICCTLYTTITVGAEQITSTMANDIMKYLFRALPFVLLPFVSFFSGALLWYWTLSNFLVLIQILILKIPAVKKLVKIPASVVHDPALFGKPKKKGIAGFKESMANMKILRELEDRERLNTVTFEKAGVGPVPRTFKKDPTKTR